MRALPLTNSPSNALVDDADFERCSQMTWFMSSQGYVVHTVNRPSQTPYTLLLARFVLGDAADGLKVDHRNHDKLDNTRSNLRACLHRENCANQKPPRIANKSSVFKGVSWDKRLRKWTAKIRVNYRLLYLGLHASEKDAARAYNVAATQHFGEFAYLNPV